MAGLDAGPRDQRPARALADYGLVYRGEPLTDDLTIAGEVRATLNVGAANWTCGAGSIVIDACPAVGVGWRRPTWSLATV